MKKYCLLLSAMLLCFLCACSVTEQNERTTMYDIMESGTDEEIAAAAAKDAQEKHDELFQLAMDESSAWYAYVDDNSMEDALKAAQDAMVDFFVSEGFSADDFSGSVEELHDVLSSTRESLSDEYIAINTRYSDILKDEAVDSFVDSIEDSDR